MFENTPWLKNKTPNFCSCLRQILTDFQIPAIKGSLLFPCRYTTLQNISFQNLYRPKAQQPQIARKHTEENVTAVDDLVLKSTRPATDSLFNALNSTIWCRTDHFFHNDLFEVLKRRLLENWLKQIVMRDSTAQTVAEWCYLHSIPWQKSIHISYTVKFTERPTVSICCNKD